jgi:hypothetical protein
MQRLSPSSPTTIIIAIDEGNSTKHHATTIITYFLAIIYDDKYNQHYSAATMVDPCHLSKYDLGFPFELLLADGFFQSPAHVPVCYVPTH